jgi:SAM-dependent methyltransferase
VTQQYALANQSPRAGDRFGALAALFDDVTFRHVEALGIRAGWRCWEVGAGGPSVPRWLAGRAGRAGSVLATDIDVSWLPVDAGFAVRGHDVAVDEPPGGGFDLVHARLVLTHVADRVEALARMAQALRPGGWLLVEDFDVDLQPQAVPDALDAVHYRANRIRAGLVSVLASRDVDLELGRKLPRLLRGAGLVDVAADAFLPLAVPATAPLERADVEQVRAGIVGWSGTTDEDIDAHLEAVASGAVTVSTPPLISAWGRRPVV